MHVLFYTAYIKRYQSRISDFVDYLHGICFVCLFVFFKGVNASFDILVICNMNIYDLTRRLLVAKKSSEVSGIPAQNTQTWLSVNMNFSPFSLFNFFLGYREGQKWTSGQIGPAAFGGLLAFVCKVEDYGYRAPSLH